VEYNPDAEKIPRLPLNLDVERMGSPPHPQPDGSLMFRRPSTRHRHNPPGPLIHLVPPDPHVLG